MNDSQCGQVLEGQYEDWLRAKYSKGGGVGSRLEGDKQEIKRLNAGSEEEGENV